MVILKSTLQTEVRKDTLDSNLLPELDICKELRIARQSAPIVLGICEIYDGEYWIWNRTLVHLRGSWLQILGAVWTCLMSCLSKFVIFEHSVVNAGIANAGRYPSNVCMITFRNYQVNIDDMLTAVDCLDIKIGLITSQAQEVGLLVDACFCLVALVYMLILSYITNRVLRSCVSRRRCWISTYSVLSCFRPTFCIWDN